MKNLVFKLVLASGLFLGSFGFLQAGPPNANFTIAPASPVIAGTTVCYTNSSTGSPTSYLWNFNGAAPNQTTVGPHCVTYNTAGTYSTCLTATNNNGSDTECKPITVVDAVNIGTVNGQTINGACGQYISDNGGSSNYTDNQNNIVTLCSGNGIYASLVFSSIDLAAGDQILVFAGTGIGGTLLSTLTSAQNGTTPTVNAGQTCLTIQFISDGATNAGGFFAQFRCNQIVMNSASNGTTVSNACGYSIFDSGYTTANYSDNENYTTTVCAGSASQVPQILFNSLNLTAGDQLNFYDGTGIGGQLIYDAVNTDNGNNSFFFPGLTVTGLSQCMTLQFISNGSGNSAGFNGSITCPTPPAPCNSNPIAADNFDAATLVCDFSQYCGTTSSFYGVDMGNIDQTAVFDGSFENNSWMSFVADATTAQFTVSTASPSCYIQIGIYGVNASEQFTWLSPPGINGGFDYTNIDTGFAGTGTLNAQGMIPGNTYYILIDGHGGSVCNYTLTAGIGVQLPEPQASPDLTMPCNDNQSISVTDLNGSTNIDWTWTWTDGVTNGGPQSGSSMNLSSFPAGTYTFTVEAADFSNCINYAIQDEVNVTITCPLPVELIDLYAVAEESANIVYWSTASESNSSHFELHRSSDGQSWNKIRTLEAAGNSSSELNYECRDADDLKTVLYYKLIQYDLDGNSTVYDPISVVRSTEDRTLLRIINMMGQEVNSSYKGMVILVFDDGTTVKTIL
jgi:PKD repeat protein